MADVTREVYARLRFDVSTDLGGFRYKRLTSVDEIDRPLGFGRGPPAILRPIAPSEYSIAGGQISLKKAGAAVWARVVCVVTDGAPTVELLPAPIPGAGELVRLEPAELAALRRLLAAEMARP